MKNKKNYTLENIKKDTESIERIEADSVLTDIYGNEIDITEAIAQADRDVEKIQSANIHFRWSQREIERAKLIAEAKGLKYQAYIKSVLKQQMDLDEKVLTNSCKSKVARTGQNPCNGTSRVIRIPAAIKAAFIAGRSKSTELPDKFKTAI